MSKERLQSDLAKEALNRLTSPLGTEMGTGVGYDGLHFRSDMDLYQPSEVPAAQEIRNQVADIMGEKSSRDVTRGASRYPVRTDEDALMAAKIRHEVLTGLR